MATDEKVPNDPSNMLTLPRGKIEFGFSSDGKEYER